MEVGQGDGNDEIQSAYAWTYGRSQGVVRERGSTDKGTKIASLLTLMSCANEHALF